MLEPEVADAGAAVHLLLERLDAIAADSDLVSADRAQSLAHLEGDVLGFVGRHASDAALTGDVGHPALTLLEAWRDEALRLDLPDAAERADTVLEALIEDEAQRWQRGAQKILTDDTLDADTRAHACVALLQQATQQDREALAREEDADFEPPLAGHRQAVRAALQEAIRAQPPSAERRRVWAQDLLDAADVVLTSVDDLAPERAGRHMRFVADDLLWHLDHIETSAGANRRRLKRKLRRLRVEIQERELQGALEHRFGPRDVARFERLIVWLIFVVLGILLASWLMAPLPPQVDITLAIVDTVACGIFLWEFFVKLAMVKGRASWFARHFFIDFLPSLPFALLTLGHHIGADNTRLARVLRLLRITRMARYLRVLMPLIRAIRAFGFLLRGLDRLVRRYGHLLNRNVILFPTREERRAAEHRHGAASVAANLWRIRTRLNTAWFELVHDASPTDRGAVIDARVSALSEARARGDTRRPPRPIEKPAALVADVPIEIFVRRLSATTPEEIEADMGQDFVARSARATRIFARPPLCWLPVLRSVVPRLSPSMSDAEVTTAAAHSAAEALGRYNDRVFWLADLHGTVTPAEFVDRLGNAMVKAAIRPARNLVVFGSAYGVLAFLVFVLGFGGRDTLKWVGSFLGSVLLLLGGVCAVVLALGWWMRSIAGQATAFLEQMAHAQYLALTEAIKGRYLVRDARLLGARVLAPESLVVPDENTADVALRESSFLRAVRRWLVEPQAGDIVEGISESVERVVLLYRDSLDGALFGESDVRTTSQLLGDPSLQQMRNLSKRIGRRKLKALQRLDLTRRRTAFRGPYIWLSFISKSITHNVARLIVDYNRHAISLKELPYAAAKERTAYEQWLGSRPGRPSDDDVERVRVTDSSYLTTSFKALHFLDDDPTSDEEVRVRYGERVLERMRTDRRMLIREIFSTAPRHLRRRELRLVNLYRVYESWLSGGRALFIPLRLLWRGLGSIGRFAKSVVRAIGEVRTPRHQVDPEAVRQADFATALRKIDRMRGPVVWATLKLRAQFDPEYLDVRLPGASATGIEGNDVDADLPFLGATPAQRREIDEFRVSARADLRRLARLIDSGILSDAAGSAGMPADAITSEHMRAAAVAYRGDYRGIRSLLSSERLLEEAAADAEHRVLSARTWWPRLRRRRRFRRWWRKRGGGHPRARKALWRAVAANEDGLAEVLAAWDGGPDSARREGIRELGELLRHPARITEQLVTLRAVQTLALVDLLNYRVQVYRLGGYADHGDLPGPFLTLGSAEREPGAPEEGSAGG